MTTVTQAVATRNGHTAEPQPSAALALRDGQDFWDAKQIAALNQLGIKDASNADLAIYLHYCQKTGLDPFARQIYMIGRKVKDGDRWVIRQTIQIGIDGYRVVAARAARRDGVILSYGETTWYDADGQPYPVWVRADSPAAASVTVYRDGSAFPGVARFGAFASFTREGQLTGQWATMGDHMIAKCAEAQALRKAFPHDLAGTHTDDETAHMDNAPARPRRPSRAVTVASTRPAPQGHDPGAGIVEPVSPPRQDGPVDPPAARAGKTAVAKLENLLLKFTFRAPEDKAVLLAWICGGTYNGSRAHAERATEAFQKALDSAEGDTEAALDALWQAYHAATAHAGAEGSQDGPGAGGGDG